MRVRVIATLFTALQAFAHGANAGAVEDCQQGADLERTITGCTEVIAHTVGNEAVLVGAYGFRGVAYAGTAKFDLAIADFSKVIALNPQDTEAYARRGEVYVAAGAYEKAIADFSKQLEIEPNSAEAYNDRGVAYLRALKYDLAIVDFTKAITINPQLGVAYSGRGGAYHDKRDYDRAITDLTKAIELAPELANSYLVRGASYGFKGEYDRSIADLSKAIELDGGLEFAYQYRGLAHLSKQELDRAAVDFSKVIEINPKSGYAYGGRGMVYAEKGEHNRAIEDLSAAIKFDPKAASFHNRARLYLETGKPWEGLADIESLLKLRPVSAEIIDTRARFFEMLGRRVDAIAEYRQALAMNPELESSRSALKRLGASETVWIEWRDWAVARGERIVAGVRGEWEKAHSGAWAKWLVPLLIAMMWLFGKPADPVSRKAQGTGVEQVSGRTSGRMLWYGGGAILLVAAIGWASR